MSVKQVNLGNLKRKDFEKHLTIKNCDKTFLKIILRLKIAKKRRRFDVS